ncbi:MAG: archaetidylserine decarboxylase [Gammaproteobacteria bacterium]
MSWWSTTQALLPQHAISRVVGAISRVHYPPFKNWLNNWFAGAYNVDLSDATHTSPTDYDSFNAMFTRHLKPGARELHGDESTVISPVDGTLSEFGRIDDNRLLQAKGRTFTLDALLGSGALADRFRNGHFATIYLAPYNYHRIHMPTAGRVLDMTLVPGRLFSVNTATAADVDNLFARNERVVTTIDSAYGAFALVAVGALNVGSIATHWHGIVTPPKGRGVQRWHYDAAESAPRGAHWGHFNMGSTVILVWPNDSVALDATLTVGQTLRLGDALGRWSNA